MHPFSVWNYFLRNKKRIAVITVGIMLGVFLLYMLSITIGSMTLSFYRSTTEPKRCFSIIYGRGATLEKGTLENIRKMDFVDRAIPVVNNYIPMQMNVGGVNNTSMLIAKPQDIQLFMNMLGLKLKPGGRLPTEGMLEVAIHEDIAKNIGIKVGDTIGSGAGNEIYFPDVYQVVGLLEGQSLVSFGTLIIDDAEKYSIALIPKQGRLAELNEYLASQESTRIIISTYESEKQSIDRTVSNIDLLVTGISITVIIIVAACVSFLSYIHFIQRGNEFALMRAIGFTRYEVIKRAFYELLLINAMATAAGFLLSFITCAVMNAVLYLPTGQHLSLIHIDSLLLSLCIPVFSSLFCIFPIWRRIKRTDPISILETA